MAWNFAEQIHSLTGFDAASTSDSETGEDFNLLTIMDAACCAVVLLFFLDIAPNIAYSSSVKIILIFFIVFL